MAMTAGLGAVIETRGLRKAYVRARGGRTVALDGLDLSVPEGGVFGFLGPNGSGKTTTIRCLLGLVRPDGGDLRLLGADPRQEAALAGVAPRVGSIVETPTFFPTFSGRRNLELLGGLYGIGRQRVDEALERVGLAARARHRVRTYSLGMKQRLGIAAALLKDPQMLILDEPANGLDPAGIREVRQLLRSLGREGRTVFLSSHILSEVQQVCDQVAILARGRCIATGPVREVLSQGRAAGVLVRLRSGEEGPGLSALAAAGVEAEPAGELIRARVAPEEAGRVTKALADAGLYLSELRPDEASLEDVFLELTGEPATVEGAATMPAPPAPPPEDRPT
jgi:ABC-2 type transport system ATP-binding protein